MSKSTVTKLFFGGIIAVVAGVLISLFAVVAAFAGGVFRVEGSEVLGVNPSPYAALLLIVGIGGALAMVGGAIAGLVAWIGALLNTIELEDKMWFVLLLVLGIFNLGLIAMFVYVLAGPDSTTQRRITAQHMPA